MTETPTIRVGVMTSGGDAQGMNAAVRAIVRSGLREGVQVYAIREGWQGAYEGGEHIVRLGWSDVSGMLNKGGTSIGTARSAAMRTPEGQRQVVKNLVSAGIDRLILIGGDGSMTGARALMLKWSEYLVDLVESGEVDKALADQHRHMIVAGIVGSIDNDMIGTDMTIGTDSAMHRITEAIDAISATAESHRRTFIVEVMGRHCGYLALMTTIAGGADYTFLPESPPRDGWEDRMVDTLDRARQAGRRDSIIVVAEGASDRQGNPISAQRIHDVILERTGEAPRVTILGHVQRGGKPSAYDRWMATACGVDAIKAVIQAEPGAEPILIGMERDKVVRKPLMSNVEETHRVAEYIEAGEYQKAISSRGRGFEMMISIYRTLIEARPTVDEPNGKRIGVMHAGALAPGMNQIDRVAVRTGLDRGYTMVAIKGGIPGLIAGNFEQVGWNDVEGMAMTGGADFGTRRYVPTEADLYQMARQLEENSIDGLLISGGFHAYATIDMLTRERHRYPAFNIPIALLPASIDNNLPCWSMAVGSDTALNTVVDAIDMVRMSASASRRAFVVETMGRHCGFLPLLGGIAGGAEKVYLPETGVSLPELANDISALVDAFDTGRTFYLTVMGEETSEHYTSEVIAKMFEAEGHGRYSVRQAIVGHTQQGGVPTPFDRVNATRLGYHGIAYLDKQIQAGKTEYGAAESGVDGLMSPIERIMGLMDWENQRPYEQWWLTFRGVADELSRRPGQE